MITIKTENNNEASLNIKEGTSYTTMLLGIEMLIEALLEELPTQNIEDLLSDLRRIYLRDKGDINDRKENS